MALQNYSGMNDDQAKVAIQSCIRGALHPGVEVKTIHDALQRELGITGVALTFNPQATEGRLPHYQHGMVMFMAHGPTGKTISG